MAKKSLHIAILDFDDIGNPLLGAGQARATYEFGRRLADRGHTITVISSRYPGSRNRKEAGIEYRHIGVGTRWIRLNNLFYIFALPASVLSLSADVIIECSTAPISTLFSPLFTRIPVVILPSTFLASLFSRKYNLPFHLIERFGTRFYRYALPYTEEIRKRITMLNPRIYCEVVPQGVGEEFFHITHSRPKYILFLSRLDIAQKGIDVLLDAYASIREKISMPLVIAGHGPDEDKIKTRIRILGLTDRVTLEGAAYGRKKHELLRSALLTALTNRGGGMSLWALESLASGVPVVCFDTPGNSWIPQTVSWKAAPEVGAYADALYRAVTDTALHEKKKTARSFAAGYSWERVADTYESFLHKVAGKEIG